MPGNFNRSPHAQSLLLAIIFIASGCAAPAHHAGGRAPSVAVIAGVPDEINRAIADAVAESLRLLSKQRVMADAQTARNRSTYPGYIRGPYQRAYFKIEVDWNHSDKPGIAAIQRKLGTDFLYVIWAPNAVRHGAFADYLVWTPADIKALDIDRVEVSVVVQLFAATGSRVVMQEEYTICLDKSGKPKSAFMDGCDAIDKIALKLGKEAGLIKGWW